MSPRRQLFLFMVTILSRLTAFRLQINTLKRVDQVHEQKDGQVRPNRKPCSKEDIRVHAASCELEDAHAGTGQIDPSNQSFRSLLHRMDT